MIFNRRHKLFWVISVFLLLFSSFSSVVFADFSDSPLPASLTIEAETVSYDQENKIIEASGSVEALYRDLTISADHLFYNTETRFVSTEAKFKLSRDGLAISGKDLRCSLLNGEGTAQAVKVGYDGVYLSGKRMSFSKNQVVLQDANFDSCGLKPPHYHLSANEVILYSDVGWVVSNWGFFWLGDLPLIPVPTYVYDITAEQKSQRNEPPFPEMGSNSQDGFYIFEKIAWHSSEKWNDRLTFAYYERKGLGGGVEGFYRTDESQDGNLRIFWNAVDQFFGGISHHHYFGQVAEGDEDQLGGIFFIPQTQTYDFSLDLSYRERIDYEKVSYFPRLSLVSRKIPWISDKLKWDFKVAGGGEAELSSGVNVAFFNGALGTYYDIPLDMLGSVLTPAVVLDSRFYGNGQAWQRANLNFDYVQKVSEAFGFKLAHQHFLYNEGISPFNFENYRFLPKDTFATQWLYQMGINQFLLKTAHYLPDLSPQDIDYSLSLGQHCYDIILNYRAMRNEVTFGFNLVSR